MNKLEELKGKIEDIVSELLYYDRKYDEDLSVDDVNSIFIENDNEFVISQLVKTFEESLRKLVKENYDN